MEDRLKSRIGRIGLQDLFEDICEDLKTDIQPHIIRHMRRFQPRRGLV